MNDNKCKQTNRGKKCILELLCAVLLSQLVVLAANKESMFAQYFMTLPNVVVIHTNK